MASLASLVVVLRESHSLRLRTTPRSIRSGKSKTMGKVGKLVAGIALIATGVVLGITGNWSLAFAVASMGVGLLTQPKTPKLAERQGNILQNRVGAQEYLPV